MPTGWRKALRIGPVRAGGPARPGHLRLRFPGDQGQPGRSPHRAGARQQLVRILRALAQPDLLDVPSGGDHPFRPFLHALPGGPAPAARDQSPSGLHSRDPQLRRAGRQGPGGRRSTWTRTPTPSSSSSPTARSRLRLDVVDHGSERATSWPQVELPERSSEDEEQAITRRHPPERRRDRGSAETAYDTWDKIVETVFLALLATTFGTLIAVPLSFLAARNLMKGITISALGLSLARSWRRRSGWWPVPGSPHAWQHGPSRCRRALFVSLSGAVAGACARVDRDPLGSSRRSMSPCPQFRFVWHAGRPCSPRHWRALSRLHASARS